MMNSGAPHVLLRTCSTPVRRLFDAYPMPACPLLFCSMCTLLHPLFSSQVAFAGAIHFSRTTHFFTPINTLHIIASLKMACLL
jgi:hypothetical protein